MREAELPDGRILEFPDNTPDSVIDATVKRELGVEQASEGRSFGGELARQGGLTIRAATEGATMLPGLLADMVSAATNKALEISGIDYRLMPTSEAVSRALTEMGVPVAETPTEKAVQGAAKTLSSAATTMGVGTALAPASTVSLTPSVAQNVGQTLTANPAIQGVSSVTGGAAPEIAAEMGAGPVGQTVAGIVAGAAPSVATTAPQSTVRGAFRGNEAGRQTVQRNIDAFKRAGTTPSVGQATERRAVRALESGLSRTPGSAGVMSRKALDQADEIGLRTTQIADDLAPRSNATRAGASIRRGVAGEGGFVDQFKARAQTLYDKVDDFIDADDVIPVSRTSAYLRNQTKPVQGAEATSKLLRSKFLDDLGIALDDDLRAAVEKGGIEGLPYSTVKQLRTLVGEKMNAVSFVDDAPMGKLKRLYGMLSQDLAEAAKKRGTQAYAAAKKADAYWKAGRERIDALERVVNKAGGTEKIFEAAISGTKEGATTLRTVMRSIGPEDQRMVTAAVVRRLGRATPGQQDASGEAFSVGTFLTNWSKLSPEARATLFGSYGDKFQQNMNALAKVASNFREGSKVFSNPSGTQASLALQAGTGGAVVAAATGNFQLLGAIAAAAGSANLTAKLMTNPRFVSWLAQTTKMPQGALAAQINVLGNIATSSKDADLLAVYEGLQNQVSDIGDSQNRQ